MISKESNKVVGFIEILIPITKCNIKCHYCYVAQRDCRTMEFAKFNRTPKQIAHALRQERFGGSLMLSICGAGETMMVKELPEIILALLKEGHFVNITTNGTVTKCFERIYEIVPRDLICRLNFSFSYHVIELQRIKAETIFWNNVKSVKENGASYMLQFNLCDGYIPYLDYIAESCLANCGALPQVAATRDEINLTNEIKLFTDLQRSEYEELGKRFQSPLFDFTMKNFMVKRKEFCCAGKWSYVLNLSTGILKPCYNSSLFQNIYKNTNKKISFEAIGKHCTSLFCMNSSHFISMGVIPEYDAPTYGELRNRICTDGTEWYTPEWKEMTTTKLYTTNPPLTGADKLRSEIQAMVDWTIKLALAIVPTKLIRKLKRKFKRI